MSTNVITADFKGEWSCLTEPLWQWDYGQVLEITGIDALPSSFAAHFANRWEGASQTVIGTDACVTIPDALLATGWPVYVWIVLTSDGTDGGTKYKITIPVNRRAAPSDYPTPAQQSAITQAINALNTAAANVAEEIAANIVDATLEVSGKAADAAVVGTRLEDFKSDLQGFNSINLVKAYGTLQNVTRGGVTFAWDAAKEVCTLTGKRTAAAYNAVFSASGGMNGCFVAGEAYHFAITSSSISTVYIRIYFNLSDSTSEQLDLKQASGTFTIPANTVGVTVRIQCDIATSVASIDETISFRILNALSNRDLERDLSTLTGTVTGLLRTETGIGNPYFAPWSVQLNESSKFSLLDMPQNTIAYTLFSYLLDTETANFPFSDFSGIYIEKIGRGNFNLYRIVSNNSERSVVGFYSSGSFSWYGSPIVKKVKIGMLGDSVTKGVIGNSGTVTTKGIPYWVNYETGQPTVNLGVGSMGWISKQYLQTMNAEEYIQTLDLSGYDVLTLQYGLNDGDQPLGTYEDTTEETIMGAVYRVIDYIYTQNSTVQVIIINPTVGSKTETFPYFNPNLPHAASDRWTFTDYFTQMRLFCEKYAIPLIDGYKGMNAWNRASFIEGNVHPTETGYRALGRYIAGQIKSMI